MQGSRRWMLPFVRTLLLPWLLRGYRPQHQVQQAHFLLTPSVDMGFPPLLQPPLLLLSLRQAQQIAEMGQQEDQQQFAPLLLLNP
jgi:hypothetical protein